VTLVEAFERVARARPDAVALRSSREVCSYAELRRRSGRLARALASLDVGPERTVGVCVPRSVSSVVAVLGVLRAGGAYVPIDPAYPDERQRFIAADADVRALVIDSRLSPTPASPAAPLVDLAALDGDDDAPTIALPPDALLNVLYTSGSTGRPKGVCGTHGAMLNRLRWAWEALPLGDDEVVAHRSALGFVDAGPEMFTGLLHGAPTAVILPDEVADLARLVEALHRQRVTRITLVPSLLAALVRQVPELAAALPALRTWISSGEALSAPLLRALRVAHPRATVVNLYGSTEVTGDATAAVFAPDTPLPDALVPIGAAIAGAELLLLDDHGAPVRDGERAELSIAGPLLARGYHRRPQEEAVRFPPHPTRPTERVFRTGDLVSRAPDGALWFHGRADDLVKVRGVRVELGEVERCLRAAAPVCDLAVVSADDGALVAFVAPPDADLDVFREAAARSLPEVMRPSRYVAVASIPLLPNGKSDRRALAAQARAARRALADDALPRSPTERRVAALWTALLRRDDVARTDTFARLGGDSLTLAELMLALEAIAPAGKVPMGLARDGSLADLALALDGAPAASPTAAWQLTLTPLGDEGARDPAVIAMLVEASQDAALCAATELPARLDEARATAYCRTRDGVVVRVAGEPVGAGIVQHHPNLGVGVEAPPGSVQLDEWLLPRWQATGILGEGGAWPLLAAWLARRFDHEVSVVWEDHLAMLAILRARGYTRLGRSQWTSAPDGDGTSGACEVWLYDLRPHRAVT
jgi:amino acid adenylation domain-containing protein